MKVLLTSGGTKTLIDEVRHVGNMSNGTFGNHICECPHELRPEKLRKDIKGHSCSMLHVQLYRHGILHMNDEWKLDQTNIPEGIINPLPYLINSCEADKLKYLNSGR